MLPTYRTAATLLGLVGLILLVACDDEPSPAEVGEACGSAGSTSPCVSGAVCTNLSGSDAEVAGADNLCLLLCERDEDCAEGEGCRGISRTSLKSCQPDTVAEGSL